MTFQNPKTWAKWVPLSEFWYNTNFHTSLQTTPFEALYGYPPPHIPMGAVPKGVNQAVNEVLQERQVAIQNLKVHLRKAQERMKKQADKKRSERRFGKGDWVYLKLQPYRHITIQNSQKYQKLRPKYYGPFEILEKVGTVAYRLSLPQGSLIHPIFHVSQLKKSLNKGVSLMPQLPLIGPESKLRIEPIAVLDRRLIKKGNVGVTQILVKWSNLADEEATWEDYDAIREQFPRFLLEDKSNLKRGRVSTLKWIEKEIVVETVKTAKEGEMTKSRHGLNGPVPFKNSCGLKKIVVDKKIVEPLTIGTHLVKASQVNEQDKGSYVGGDHLRYHCVISINQGVEDEKC